MRTAVRYLAERLPEAFGPAFFLFAGIALASGTACYVLLGPEAFERALDRDGHLLLALFPRILAAVAVAGLVQAIVPREKLGALLGRESGVRGLAIAALAGMVTPGGPFASFTFMVMLRDSGIDRGALVAYATGWALLGIQRILVWDIPMMGPDFTILRFAVSAPLPILAGLLARRIPVEPFGRHLPGAGRDREDGR